MSTSNVQPLYQQIYDDIKSDIESGVYQVDDKIPSETELSEKYNVSRITVRRAIEDLCADNLLTKKQGRGTFVGSRQLKRRLEQSLESRSFTEMCAACGAVPRAEVVDRQIIPARPNEIKFFGLSEGALILYIRRIRYADDLPIVDERVILPYEWASNLYTHPLENVSMFKAVAEILGRKPVKSSSWTINAVRATTEQSSRLDISVGAPLIVSESYFVDKEKKPVYIGKDFFVGGRYELSL